MRSPLSCHVHGLWRLTTRATLLTAACLATVTMFPHVASADTVACQRAIAKGTARFAQAKMKRLQKCEDGIVNHVSTGPCPDASAAAKIAQAESKLRSAVSKGCGGGDRTCGAGGDDEPLTGIGWSGGACPNFESGACSNAVTNCNGVSDCVACVGHAAVNQAIDLYYGSANVGTTDSDVTKCQRAIGKYTAKFFAAKSKALQKCEDGIIKGTTTGPCRLEKGRRSRSHTWSQS